MIGELTKAPRFLAALDFKPATAGPAFLAREFSAARFETREVSLRAGRHHLETQRAGRGNCFQQFDLHRVTQAITFAAARANKRVRGLYVREVLVAQARDRNIAVSSRIFEPHEQPRARDARNACREARANAICEMRRDQAVHGFALGRHGAPLGIRNRFRNGR